ncbi:MAG: septum formation initiator family protein [Gemmatimonadota bacterium]|nr:septum formation initiator family protein [Gemmatimonadota bacterium]
MPTPTATTPRAGSGALLKRAIVVVLAVAIAAFAVQGGEWGTFDLMAQKRRIARLELAVDSLQHVVDSLKTYKGRIATDPALQERIAREEFGMVRGNKELLYRFAEPSGAGPRP